MVAAKTWIEDSLKSAQGYFNDFSSLGTRLIMEQIGEIVYEDAEFKIEDTQSKTLREMTLLKMENAHMIIYFIGEVQIIEGKRKAGLAGCIGCICRPDRTVSKFD